MDGAEAKIEQLEGPEIANECVGAESTFEDWEPTNSTRRVCDNDDGLRCRCGFSDGLVFVILSGFDICRSIHRSVLFAFYVVYGNFYDDQCVENTDGSFAT